MKLTTTALVVTKRPRHAEWWSRQILKQTRAVDEIVVVANHPEPYTYPSMLEHRLLHVVHAPPDGTWTLGDLRQLALNKATKDVVLWFDDDDWYHPRRVELSMVRMEDGSADAVFFPSTHLYVKATGTLHDWPAGAGFSLPSAAWRRSALAKAPPFRPLMRQEDGAWMSDLFEGGIIVQDRIHYITRYLEPHLGGIVTVHGNNTWLYDVRHAYDQRGAKMEGMSAPLDVSEDDWQWTCAQIEALGEGSITYTRFGGRQ